MVFTHVDIAYAIGLQHGTQVLHHLMGLAADVLTHHGAGLGVQGYLAGGE